MRFTAKLQLPKFDKAGYRRAMNSHMTAVIQDAARLWLNATVASLIPIWSGASAATFLKLARAASYDLAPAPIGGVQSRTGLGQRESTGNIVAGRTQYWFEYGTTLRHLIFNEFNDANAGGDPAVFAHLVNPGPYQFQKAGQAAFMSFARTVRLPNPFDYVKVTQRVIT